MSEEKKGKLKVSLEVEINEELMGVMKEGISKMHWKMPDLMKRGEEEKKQMLENGSKSLDFLLTPHIFLKRIRCQKSL